MQTDNLLPTYRRCFLFPLLGQGSLPQKWIKQALRNVGSKPSINKASYPRRLQLIPTLRSPDKFNQNALGSFGSYFPITSSFRTQKAFALNRTILCVSSKCVTCHIVCQKSSERTRLLLWAASFPGGQRENNKN